MIAPNLQPFALKCNFNLNKFLIRKQLEQFYELVIRDVCENLDNEVRITVLKKYNIQHNDSN